jgi:hypothetical protein
LPKEDEMDPDSSATVKVLLDAANLSVSDEEFEKFTDLYPDLRAHADGLYLPELDLEEPAVSFDPAVGRE